MDENAAVGKMRTEGYKRYNWYKGYNWYKRKQEGAGSHADPHLLYLLYLSYLLYPQYGLAS